MTIYKSIIIALFIPFIGIAQVDLDSELFLELEKMDTLLFEEGFNNCSKEAMEAALSEDLEFFHDNGGITKGKPAFITSFLTNMCDANKKPIRKLVPESLTVFPLRENGTLYGAIQKGVHEFFIKEPGKELYKTQVAQFTHLWIKEETGWKISRVLSYDHKAPETDTKGITVPIEVLTRYAGNYKAPQTGNIIISIKEGVMHLDAGEMQTDLITKSSILFAHPQAPIELKFVSNPDGSIKKFVVLENGKVVEEAQRIER
ncbi:nuclear transport factor 2 family protein [Dokdonia ponticola]|uniref:Nuclear transport factor 2 family protein n=1 Tax=Dokdonia ponticola TaxID=2041041 RepID=A0ABV9HRR9_9FLAO